MSGPVVSGAGWSMMAAIGGKANLLAGWALAWLLAGCSGAGPLLLPLTSQGNIRLPADQGAPAIDLLTMDPRTGLLYVPHGSNAALDLVDVKAGRVAASIAGLPDIKGVALTPDPNVVFTSNGGDGTVGVVDVAARKVLVKVQVGGKPDAIGYDPVHDLVVVGLRTSNKMAVVGRAARQLRATVDLPGEPELMAIDEKAGQVYLAVHDRDAVVRIDLAKGESLATYRGCDIMAPTGVAYDADHSRLFVAGPTRVSVVDVLLDHCLGTVDVGSGTDQIAINPHTHHLYAASRGSRNVSVIDTVSLKPLGVVGTGPGGGTLAVDPTTDRLYVAVTKSGLVAVYHDP